MNVDPGFIRQLIAEREIYAKLAVELQSKLDQQQRHLRRRQAMRRYAYAYRLHPQTAHTLPV